MITVTPSAVQAVSEFFKTQTLSPIRIFLSQGCCGPQLGMALDTINGGDTVHAIGGFEFIIQKDLLSQIQPVEVDFTDSTFRISSSLEPEAGGGCQGCGSSANCCGS
ncbi:IscA/HesB family protein [Desulfosarcina sp. OttesenSCG-928-A07]|nr:IscA/HesB family protein [Desulfosarcina sp. OttesenSCG-928-G17]MDL2328316.1 IscA/HesB family protein [Desulfosarcina sp. OttesenSCG-928-A07]